YGVLVDAYVETGDYDNAVKRAQKMVDLKPGTAAYSRVAQIRSLHGDHRGAVEMFSKAARAADPNDKETQSWCLVQLGDEYWKVGKFVEAEKTYDEALTNLPGYFLAVVSKGRVRASVGDFASAEQLLTDVQADLPNANAILMLGDIYTLRGEVEKAARQYEQFDAIQEKLGTAADHKRLVLSWADRGMVDKALALAKSEYAAEKSIHSADLMAWSLYRAGRATEATVFIREAMRLNTIDARLLFHAGMIAKENGDLLEAKRLLTKALKQNPAFDLVGAEEARDAVARR
ncbi:MAG TPA: tetratricopeptide repeat protein, partial [Pyrinomonadaceae bacterium]|nr:tetratricopeptide repeat protein [Pyrinomonadaceae bacterium]